MTIDKILAEIDSEIAQLKQARALLSGHGTKETATPATPKKRKLSAAARKKIGDAHPPRRRRDALMSTKPSSPPVKSTPAISRRAFLVSSAAAGGALVVGLTLRRRFHHSPSGASRDPFNAWIHIQPDGQTQLVLNKSEMRQGVFTALSMILAEEAELDFSRISVIQADNADGTGGSGSVREGYKPLRQAGARVREVLVAAAARRWNVPATECRARNSQVIHALSGRSLSYGALVAEARRLPLPDAKTIPLKDPRDFTLLGRSIPPSTFLTR